MPWLLLTAGLAAVGLGIRQAADWAMRQPSIPEGSTLLADGTYIRLAQVSFGRAHRLGPPPPRFPWLAGRLPDWLTGRQSHIPTIQTSYPEDNLVLWLTRHTPAQPLRTAPLDSWLDYQVVDSHGCRFDSGDRTLRTEGPNGSYSSSTDRGSHFSAPSPPEPAAYSVGLVALPSFPRREAGMALRLFGQGWGDRVELIVGNPAPTLYPEWTPDVLPATRTDGDVTVRLTAVNGRLNRWSSNGFEERHQEVKPEFEIMQGGRRSDAWSPGDLQVSDATGNGVPSWDTRLCTREKAWKLRARFWRKPQARFSPDEVWVVDDIPVPATGKIRPLTGSKTIQGAKLSLLAVAGRGSFRYKNGVPSEHETPLPEGYSETSLSTGGSTSTRGGNVVETDYHVQAGQPHVGIRVEGLRDDQHLDLVAVDDQGRKFASERSSANDQQRYFAFEVPKDARTLTLRCMVHRCRTAEFLIQPPAFRE